MNLLQRMPQSAKVALVAGLLVLAVVIWYLGFFRPNQAVQAPPTPAPSVPPPPTATARPLEVLPLPFLVTEATRPNETGQPGEPGLAAQATPPRITVPPNPFIPLVVEAPASPSSAPAAPATGAPAPPVTAQPIPTQTARVQVRQPAAPLPTPSLPGTRPTTPTPPLPAATQPPSAAAPPAGQARLAQGTARTNPPAPIALNTGALPIRLTPLERELAAPSETPQVPPALDLSADISSPSALEFARAELNFRTAQALELRATPPRSPEAPRESPLARFVREQNLRLSGVVLGPTSVAIFQGRDGFIVLPVGRTLPGSDVLLKSLSAKEALLVQGSESLTLPIEKP